VFIILLYLLTIPVGTAQASAENTAREIQGFESCADLPEIEWREARTISFAVIYPAAHEVLGQGLYAYYGSSLDREYARFSAIFEESLPVPVSIRIYPNDIFFTCLNALAPPLSGGGTHSHIGSREISLIGAAIGMNPQQWLEDALSSLRFELAILFTERISEGKAPPGLLAGVGHYGQDPTDLFREGSFASLDPAILSQTWRALWEDENTLGSTSMTAASGSIVAYLVDAYGWSLFLDFLRDLPTSAGYRQSLSEIYTKELPDLQVEWQSYSPMYFAGRWRAHAWYAFDLSTFEDLVDAGAFSAATAGLREAITFLEKNGDEERLAQARALLERATTGEAARNLLEQSRQALQAGEYTRSLELTVQAEAMLAGIGDAHLKPEIEAYRSWAEEALTLRAQVNTTLQALEQNPDNPTLLKNLAEAGSRLTELGDTQGQEAVINAFERARVQQEKTRLFAGLVAGILSLGLLAGLLVIFLNRKPPKEAQLW
jgi:hypothetical protein